MIWFTSDLHFYHKNVIKHCRRPFDSVEEMNRALIENWNSCVKKREMVWVLGDFAFAGIEKTREIIEQLNGDIRCVRGNHDRHAKQLIDMGFSNVYENHQIELDGMRVNLSHFPHYPVDREVDPYNQREYAHKRIVNKGMPLLHGHTHRPEKNSTHNGIEIHVGVDARDYKPVSSQQIIKEINELKRSLYV